VTLSLFLVESLPVEDTTVLSGPEGHHAADVQRLRVGERLLLGDGRGGTALVSVAGVGRARLELSILDRRYVALPSPRLVVAQGLAKGDRGELAVQAMTEVGVDAIVPWSAARSVVLWRDGKGMARWQATVREAAKQARRAWLPELEGPQSTDALAGRVTFVLDAGAEARLSTVEIPAAEEIVLAVGPEGGIAPEELDRFTAAGAVQVRLGEAVLRTSTAGVAALSVLSARLGRW
jgi:16S rRNA (uracil1498-N3)-methyltransferase